MDFMYCECGGKTPKTGLTVNFCSSCGEPFNKALAKSKQSAFKPKIKPKPIEPEDDDEDDFDEDDDNQSSDFDGEIPVPSVNDVVISGLETPTYTVRQLAAGEKVEPLGPGKAIKFTKQELAKKLLKDGGSSKPK